MFSSNADWQISLPYNLFTICPGIGCQVYFIGFALQHNDNKAESNLNYQNQIVKIFYHSIKFKNISEKNKGWACAEMLYQITYVYLNWWN